MKEWAEYESGKTGFVYILVCFHDSAGLNYFHNSLHAPKKPEKKKATRQAN